MHKIIEVKYVEDHIVLLTFDDGAVKVFDFGRELVNTALKPLADVNVFKKVEIDCGSLRWPEYDIDVCYDWLYQAAVPLKAVIEVWKGAA